MCKDSLSCLYKSSELVIELHGHKIKTPLVTKVDRFDMNFKAAKIVTK